MLVPIEDQIEDIAPEASGTTPMLDAKATALTKKPQANQALYSENKPPPSLVPIDDEFKPVGVVAPAVPQIPQEQGTLVGRNLRTGARQVKGLGIGLKGLAQNFFGDEEGAKQTFENYLKYEEETARLNPNQIGTIRNIHGVGEAGKYIVETVFQQIPMIIPSLISGIVGAVAGTAVEPGGGTVAGGVAGLGIKTFGRKLIQNAIEKQVAKGLTRKAAQAVVQKQMGAMLGSFTSATALNASEDYLELYKRTGEGHPVQAVSIGAIKGALDVLPDVKIISKMLGVSTRDLKKSIFKNLGRYGDALIGQAILEGPTEMAQYALDEISVAIQGDTTNKSWSDIVSEGVDNLVAGSIAGGILSVATEPIVRDNIEQKKQGKQPDLLPPTETTLGNSPAPSVLPTDEELAAKENAQNETQQVSQAEGPIDVIGQPVAELFPANNTQTIPISQAVAQPATEDQLSIDDTFSKHGVEKGSLRVVEKPKNDPRADLAEKVGEFSGKRVVFFEDSQERGYVLEGAPTDSTIFVNTKAKNPLQVVAIHEATHRMEKEAPDIYTALENAITGAAKTEDGKSFSDFTADLLKIGPYNEADAKREFVARVMGQRGTESEFWTDLLKTGDKTAIEKFIEIITRIVDAVKSSVGLGAVNTDTDKYLADVQKVREAAVKALQEYAKTKTEPISAKPGITPDPQAAPVAQAVPQQPPTAGTPTAVENGAAFHLAPRTAIEREIAANVDALEKRTPPTDQREFVAWRTALNEAKATLAESLSVANPTQADIDNARTKWEQTKAKIDAIRQEKPKPTKGEQSKLFQEDKDLLQTGSEQTAKRNKAKPAKIRMATPKNRVSTHPFMEAIESPIPILPAEQARGKGEYDAARGVYEYLDSRSKELRKARRFKEAKLYAEARDRLFVEKDKAHIDSWMQEKADPDSSLIAPMLKGAEDFDGLAKQAKDAAEAYVFENMNRAKKPTDQQAAEIMYEAAQRGIQHDAKDFKGLSKDDIESIKAVGKSEASPMLYTDPDTLRDVPVYKSEGTWKLQNVSGEWQAIPKKSTIHNNLETWVEAQNAPQASDVPFSAEPSNEQERDTAGLIRAKQMALAAGLAEDFRANRKTDALNNQIADATGWKKTPEGVWASTEKPVSTQDARYLELAKDPEGNKEQLQAMVDAAADDAGFTTIEDYFHFTKAETLQTLQDNIEHNKGGALGHLGMFLTRDRDFQGAFSVGAGTVPFAFYVRGNLFDPQRVDADSVARAFLRSDIGRRFYEERSQQANTKKDFTENLADEIRNGGLHDLNEILENEEFVSWLSENGYDGVDAETNLLIFDPLANVRSSDPITRDDSGRIIPLSERFNPQETDIRLSAEPILRQHMTAEKVEQNEKWSTYIRTAAKEAFYNVEGDKSRVDRAYNTVEKAGFNEAERAFETSDKIPDDLRTASAYLVAEAYQQKIKNEIDPKARVRLMNDLEGFMGRVYKYAHDTAVDLRLFKLFHTKQLTDWAAVQHLMKSYATKYEQAQLTTEEIEEMDALTKEVDDAAKASREQYEAVFNELEGAKEQITGLKREARDLKALMEDAGNRAIADFLAKNDGRLKHFSQNAKKHTAFLNPRRNAILISAKENGFILAQEPGLSAEPTQADARINAFATLTSQFIMENTSTIGSTTFFPMREGDSLRSEWRKYAVKVFGDQIIPQLNEIWNSAKYEAILVINEATAKRKTIQEVQHKTRDKTPPAEPQLVIDQIAAQAGVTPSEVLTELQAAKDAKTNEDRIKAKQKALVKLQKLADKTGITIEEAQVLVYSIARKQKAEDLVDWATNAKITSEQVAQKIAQNNLTAWAKKHGITEDQARAELERMYNEAEFKDAEAARIFDMLNPTRTQTRNLTPSELAARQHSLIRRMGLIRYELGRMGVRVSELVKMNITDQTDVRDTLINELITSGVNSADAAKIAVKARAIWSEIIDQQTAKLLEQKNNRKNKDVVEQVVEAMKSSSFNYDVVRRLFAQKYGLRAITPEFVARMRDLHNKLKQTVETGGGTETSAADGAREAILIELSKHFDRGWGEHAWAFVYSQLLGGLPTHVFNLAVTGARFAGNQLLDPLHTVLVAGKQLLKGERRKASDTIRSQFNRWAMLKTAFSYGGAQSWYTFTTGRTPHDTVGKWENDYTNVSPAEYADFFNNGKFNPLRAIKYIQRALRAEDILFRIPLSEQESYWRIFNEEQASGKTGKALFESVGKRMGYSAQKNMELFNDINRRADALGLKGAERTVFIHNEIAKQRGSDVRDKAATRSLSETFNDPNPYGLPGMIHHAIRQAQSQPGMVKHAARFFGMFSRVTANALNFVIETTPLQFMRLGFDALHGHYEAGQQKYVTWTTEQRARMAEKAAVGTLLAGYFIAKAQESYEDWKEKEGEESDPPFWFTGYGPRNPAIRSTWLKTHTPYSMTVNGKNIKIWMLGPAVGPALIAGTWMDAHRYIDKDENEEQTLVRTLGMTTLGIMQFLEDEMPAQGLMDLIETASSNQDGAWGRYARNQANSIVNMVMPIPFYRTIRDIDRGMIPGAGDPTVITDKLKPWYYGTLRNIPFVRSEVLTPARNVFGEPITKKVWARFADTVKNDPDINFLVLADKSFRAPSMKDTAVFQFKNNGLEARDSTAEEYDRFLVLFGAALRDEVATVRKTYNKRTDFDEYADQIKKRLSQARQSAMTRASAEYYKETGTLLDQKPKE